MIDIKKYREADIDTLASLAQNKDKVAFDFLQVAKFNKYCGIGDTVTYLKSEIEGKARLKTTGVARLLTGESIPVVQLELIGDVLLSKIEINIELLPIPAQDSGIKWGKCNFNIPSVLDESGDKNGGIQSLTDPVFLKKFDVAVIDKPTKK